MKLSEDQLQDFIKQGFIKIENAFPQSVAEEARSILWKEMGLNPVDSSTWTTPVVRLGYFAQQPFQDAVNTPALHQAFDQLVGKGRWLPRNSIGSFPVRFPSEKEPNDTGWHVDASFSPDNNPDYFQWRINIFSDGRALLMLFLFSDVEEEDAPTRIRVGSHLDVARLLAPQKINGLTAIELAKLLNRDMPGEIINATGKAGNVYLCHPFLVHAAQAHYGKNPRFLAQPPLLPAEPFRLHRADGNYSPVESAIRLALS
jgi:hypothetical protein